MIEFFLALFVVVIVVTICLHHHSMKTKLYESSDCDARLALKADQNSIRASNTKNDLIALIETVRSIQILECLLDRHTASTASDLAGVNISEMLKVFTEQRNKIFDRLVQKYPELAPKKPLGTYVLPRTEEKQEEEEEGESSSSSSEEEYDRHRRKHLR